MIGLEEVFMVVANNITDCIQARSDSYFINYEILRDDVTVMLESLGSRGEFYSRVLETDSSDIIDSLKSEFNSTALITRVVGGMRAVEKRFSEDLLNEVRNLQTAVDEHPTAITCWDSNKVTLRNIFLSVFMSGKDANYVNLMRLDARISKVVKKIDGVIARIAKQVVLVCRNNSKCIISYVSLEIFKF
jgi:hypothetical protein